MSLYWGTTKISDVNAGPALSDSAGFDTQSLEVTPTESTQVFNSSQVDGYMPVTVNAVSKTYVGSGVARKSSSDLTASGATVTVPAGYYESQGSKAVASGNVGDPSWNNVKTETSISFVGSYENFTPGYISSISNATRMLSLQEETVTPSTTQRVITPATANSYLNKVTVEAIPSGTAGTPTATKGTVSNYSISITPSVTNTTGYISGGTKSGTAVTVSASELVSGTLSVTSNGTKDVTNYASINVNVPTGGGGGTYQSKSVSPSESKQTVTPDTGYDALSSVVVNAIASDYVGSGVTRRTGSDLSVSGATVTAPSGFYASQVSTSIPSGTAGTPVAKKGAIVNDKITITPSVTNTAGYISGGTVTGTAITVTASELVEGVSITIDDSGNWNVTSAETAVVPAGTEGTPTASKGSVSNHSILITPSVTNSAGWIDGGTKTGTAVSVSASELVSGTYTVSSTGTKDVTNYASISVPSGTAGTPSASKGTVSNHSVSVTPSVTNVTGFISGGTKSGTAVTVSASELVSGTLQVTSNGQKDVTNYASVNVAIPFVTYYTGSSAPSSTLGQNGDIYLKVVT